MTLYFYNIIYVYTYDIVVPHAKDKVYSQLAKYNYLDKYSKRDVIIYIIYIY